LLHTHTAFNIETSWYHCLSRGFSSGSRTGISSINLCAGISTD